MTSLKRTPSNCPICGAKYPKTLGDHVREVHDEATLKEMIFQDKQNGVPDVELGTRYRISYTYLQKLITEKLGTNVSLIKPKKIKTWEPKDFSFEASSVWSFRSRGNWATHDGRYRGNWSPFIPRNIILRYSKPGDIVLDQFIGGGTTAVEAKLLGRRCMARDINPFAVELARANSNFAMPAQLGAKIEPFEPEFNVGDARQLAGIDDQTIDLICTHPPYAGIVNYSGDIPEDMSKLSVPEFLINMRTVADECFRVLKPKGKCTILIGDGRKSKRVVPIGFQTIRQFLDAGFILKDLVIKRQHNCKTTGFWYKSSLKYNFLLLAHEYLPIFEKPKHHHKISRKYSSRQQYYHHITKRIAVVSEEETFETTTVWLDGDTDTLINRNISKRFAKKQKKIQQIEFSENAKNQTSVLGDELMFIKMPSPVLVSNDLAASKYLKSLSAMTREYVNIAELGEVLVVEVQDICTQKGLIPFGFLVFNEMQEVDGLSLKEIVTVAPATSEKTETIQELAIAHRYLLFFEKL